ncbi:MAG: UvrD-helicase domain-containing protein [Synergistaceae bacterium]|jgi:hypothetical protein|nr:UvrD-helicase domain-containing protein [Synergistaceae bacterium]
MCFGSVESIEELFQICNADEERPLPEFVPAEVIIADVKAFAARDEYETLDDPSRIIESDIRSKILVNAAPGSGKTYTVIRRLEYIISNRMVNDFSGVLVLVYTNAAKNEIQSRLESGILDGSLPYSARNIDICTFDSLATSYLAAVGVPFGHLDYNGRIRLFNVKFANDDFSNFEYVIVDELQDLVNERAKMILNILGALKGGYLLLGDKCQAIYDYDCHDGDSVDSVEFYKRLNELFPPDILKYELSGNQRQTDRLAGISDNLRRALLGFEPRRANELIADELKQIQVTGSVERFDFSDISHRTAILCRNNGEAEYLSHLFHKKHVRHTLLRGVAQPATLRRFIADCLWDYHADSRITREEFIRRFRARVPGDDETAGNMFDALSEAAYGNAKQAVEIENLAQTLRDPAAKLPDGLLNERETLLTVSTVHKAKGREFDTVYLLDSNFPPDDTGNTEEARVWYVGCTRAKTALYKLSKKNLYLKRSSNYIQRWTRRNIYKARYTPRFLSHCSSIVLGLPTDFSDAGFVRGDFAAALKTQEYIARNVNAGDNAEVVLVDGKYQVRHRENIIGYLAENMPSQLREIARESNPASGAPPYLFPVYVANVVTITPFQFPNDVHAYFRESRFWLGVELTGFPEIAWHFSPIKSEGSSSVWEPNLYEDWSAIK